MPVYIREFLASAKKTINMSFEIKEMLEIK
jgi:hypothetical protein